MFDWVSILKDTVQKNTISDFSIKKRSKWIDVSITLLECKTSKVLDNGNSISKGTKPVITFNIPKQGLTQESYDGIIVRGILNWSPICN